jgi:hypothetical protein
MPEGKMNLDTIVWLGDMAAVWESRVRGIAGTNFHRIARIQNDPVAVVEVVSSPARFDITGILTAMG